LKKSEKPAFRIQLRAEPIRPRSPYHRTAPGGFAKSQPLVYPQGMAGFFTALFDEMGERRRRLRLSLGDRGQALASFAILAGLALGSLGLFLRPWMADVAPWGFAIPLVFVIGYLLIDWRRQSALAQGGDAETLAIFYDWTARLFSLACALAGAAAFVIALTSEPIQQIEEWTPPESAVSVDISP
jgi:hypothetical protein